MDKETVRKMIQQDASEFAAAQKAREDGDALMAAASMVALGMFLSKHAREGEELETHQNALAALMTLLSRPEGPMSVDNINRIANDIMMNAKLSMDTLKAIRDGKAH